MSQRVYLDLPLERTLGYFDEIQATGYSGVSLFTDWKQAISSIRILDQAAYVGNAGSFHVTICSAQKIDAGMKLHPIESLDAELLYPNSLPGVLRPGGDT